MSRPLPARWSLRARVIAGVVSLALATVLVLALAWAAFDRSQRAGLHAEHSHDLQLACQSLLRAMGELVMSQGAPTPREHSRKALADLDHELGALAAEDAALHEQLQLWTAVKDRAQSLLSLQPADPDDGQALVHYGRLTQAMKQFLPAVQAAHARAEDRLDSAVNALAAWLVGGLVALTLLVIWAGTALLAMLDRQLGGDPRLAHDVSARMADGDLDTPVPHTHPHSVMAALEHVRLRLLERRSIEQRVQYLARHDTLSGALNRSHFNELMGLAIEQARRDGGSLGVLYIDLDRFKEVNDTLGHAHGDEVIRICAQRLRALLRHGDHLARLGGDEFAVLVHGLQQLQDLEALAGRITAALAVPMPVASQELQLGASVGVAMLDGQVTDREDLMHRADLAMYRAKAAGRGGFSVYNEALDEQLRERRDLVRDLRVAIEGEQLCLHYQPIFARDGVELVGYEALLRWRHPQRGLVPPDVFVPLAEDAGIIDALGRWVMRRACQDAATWPSQLKLAINLSVSQLESPDLVSSLGAALDLAGLQAQRLQVEITESMLMTHREPILRALQGLAALGVGIVVDDFGTGYSSLAYLWRYDFDKLKIDRSFVADLKAGTRVHTVVRSIISLAHSLGMKVTAEGVERPEQMQLLQHEDCDELQGYLLGRPAEHTVHGAPASRVAPAEVSVA